MVDRSLIGGTSEHTVERIDLAHQVTLSKAPDRGVAAHRTELHRIERYQCDTRAHSRCGARRLDARMPAANDDNIVFIAHDCST